MDEFRVELRKGEGGLIVYGLEKRSIGFCEAPK
jgi:hypothetical protein